MTDDARLELVLTSPTAPADGRNALEFSGFVVGPLAADPALQVNGRLDQVLRECDLDPIDELQRRPFRCHFDLDGMWPGFRRFTAVAHAAHSVAVIRHDVTPDEHPRRGMHGVLDLPTDDFAVRGDVLDVRGWCLFDHSATSYVEVFVNGESVGRARPYLDRADVAFGWPHRDAPMCGFSLYVPVRGLGGAGTLDVAVEAVSLDGRRWRSQTRRARAGIVEHERDQAAYAEVLADRTRQAIDRTRGPASRKVAVVTHDLGYGGGQLWLSEMLRQFTNAALFEFEVFSIADGPLRAELEGAGIPVHVTSRPSVETLRAHEDRVRELAALLTSAGAAAVLVNTVIPFQAIDAAARIGIPSLWAIHESFDLDVYCQIVWGDHIDRTVRQRFAATFALADGLVFEAPQTAELFASMSTPYQRRVVDYGVDIDDVDRYRAGIDRSRSRATHGWDDDDVVLVVVGVFEGRKAQGAMVAVFDELADVHPRLHLALVGMHDSGYCEGVADQVSRSRHGDRIHLERVTPDIQLWYVLADLLVCASDIESLPRSILEAMAFELPVVSTDVFGVATLLDDGRTGWLTQVSDVRSLTATLDRVVRLDRSERAAVATRARADVVGRSGALSYGVRIARALDGLMRGASDPLAPLPAHQGPS